MSVTSIVDENNKSSLSALGIKRYGTSNLFIFANTVFNSISAKQEAITLGYKILGLE